MRKPLCFVACLLVSLVVGAFLETPAAAQAAPAGTNLKPKFVAGRTAKYEVWSLRKQAIKLTFMGESQEVDSVLETTGEVTWRIEKVNADGSATCTMTLEWLTARSKATGAEETSVDSRKAPGAGASAAMHELLKAMTGAPITVEMTADGSVTSVKGVDAIHGRLKDPENAPDDLDFMETAADLAAITAAQENMTPNKSWKAAADWNHELGKLHHDTTYTLGGVEDVAGIQLATVTGVSKLRLDLDNTKLPAAGEGPKIDIKLTKGDANTQVMFDLSRREAVGRNSVQTTSIEARITHNGQVLSRLMDETIQSQALRISEK